ncbi:uncharacterized protein [Euphorbia lathyris]|uniref:uncharacterized protein n=1 Tax=Euphorbia lathyris TaxID=212925 RepID=UPI003313A546
MVLDSAQLSFDAWWQPIFAVLVPPVASSGSSIPEPVSKKPQAVEPLRGKQPVFNCGTRRSSRICQIGFGYHNLPSDPIMFIETEDEASGDSEDAVQVNEFEVSEEETDPSEDMFVGEDPRAADDEIEVVLRHAPTPAQCPLPIASASLPTFSFERSDVDASVSAPDVARDPPARELLPASFSLEIIV